MKHSAFSLTEVIIVIFTIAVIAVVIIPMKIIDINQAERIAKWKDFYPELVYSFDVMKHNEKDIISEYKVDWSLNPYDFFNIYKKYLNIDTEKNISSNYSNYHHIFLNGKIIKSISKYRADEFLYLKNGMILGFTAMDRDSNNIESAPLGILLVDVNGKTKRNFIGKDVFAVLLFADKIEPMGYDASRQEMKEDCSPVGSGVKCAAYYLVGGAF